MENLKQKIEIISQYSKRPENYHDLYFYMHNFIENTNQILIKIPHLSDIIHEIINISYTLKNLLEHHNIEIYHLFQNEIVKITKELKKKILELESHLN